MGGHIFCLVFLTKHGITKCIFNDFSFSQKNLSSFKVNPAKIIEVGQLTEPHQYSTQIYIYKDSLL